MLEPSVQLRHYQETAHQLIAIAHRIGEIDASVGLQVVVDERFSQHIVASIGEYQRTSLNVLLEQIDRLLNEPFRLVVIGKFSYGKTTLLNALLGRPLLKSDWRPNTAISTVIRYGKPERFTVHYRSEKPVTVDSAADLASELAKYTSDTSIGKDSGAVMRGEVKSLSADIQRVEVWLNAAFLRNHQVELIDTPGLGSVLEGHQRVTYNTVPQAHCVLFMAQIDLNIGEEEVSFLTSVSPMLDRFVYVLTKADMLDDKQKVRDAEHYLRDVLRTKVGVEDTTIQSIAAVLALEGDYPGSGLSALIAFTDDKLMKTAGIPRLLEVRRLLLTYVVWLKSELSHQVENLSRRENDFHKSLQKLDADEKNSREMFKSLMNAVQSFLSDEARHLVKGQEQWQSRLQAHVESVIDSVEVRDTNTINLLLSNALENGMKIIGQELLVEFVHNIKPIVPFLGASMVSSLKLNTVDLQFAMLDSGVVFKVDYSQVSASSLKFRALTLLGGLNEKFARLLTHYLKQQMVHSSSSKRNMYAAVLEGGTIRVKDGSESRIVEVLSGADKLTQLLNNQSNLVFKQLEAYVEEDLNNYLQGLNSQKSELKNSMTLTRQQLRTTKATFDELDQIERQLSMNIHDTQVL